MLQEYYYSNINYVGASFLEIRLISTSLGCYNSNLYHIWKYWSIEYQNLILRKLTVSSKVLTNISNALIHRKIAVRYRLIHSSEGINNVNYSSFGTYLALIWSSDLNIIFYLKK